MLNAHDLFVAKGLLALLGVVLLIWHMDRAWPTMPNPAQRLRYIVLLGFGVLLVGASTEQIAQDPELGLRHWAALTMAVALVAVAIYSIYDNRRQR